LTAREQLVAEVAKHLHAGQLLEAGRAVAVFSGFTLKKCDNPEQAKEFCYSLLHWCLDNDRYDLAASMLWGKTLFNYEPRCTRMVWEQVKGHAALMLMGSASMSKSYGCGVWLFLDWLRDPEYTNVIVVGPSEQHLKDNLFTHLVTLHTSATLPMPGHVGDLFIGLDPKMRKSAIAGLVMPIGKRAAGRLQGRKRVPRKIPHPKFGTLSRIRIFIDELEKVPQGIWKDIDNVFSTFEGDAEGFKLIAAFNPEDINGQAAARCEPEKGWLEFDPEVDEVWTSKRGWRVLRLDAAKSENVTQKKLLFPGLQSYEGFQRIIQNAGGTDTPGYWSMARGCFPRAGAIYSVIPSTLVGRLKGEFMFGETPENVGGVDLALEGGDVAEFAVGRFGKAIGIRYPKSFDHPNGREELFKNRQGKRVLRWACQVDQVFPLPSADTVKMAEQVKAAAIKFMIKPRNLMCDRTGNGAGVHDLLKNLWSEEVQGVNYSGGASERKILEEDTQTALEEYEKVISELWFALKKWAEHKFFMIAAAALTEELVKELSGRRYAPGKCSKVESKPDYKSRGNGSPNKADAVTLLLHGVRLSFLCIPSAVDDCAGTSVSGSPDRDEMICIVDESNRFDDLERESDGREAYGDTFNMWN
jgi:hypothetical protein